MKDFTRLKTRKLTCNHRHINKVNGKILCCNENVIGILKNGRGLRELPRLHR